MCMNATKPAHVELFKMFHDIRHKKMLEDFYIEEETSLCQVLTDLACMLMKCGGHSEHSG